MINEARIRELTEEVGEDDLVEVIELFCEEVEEVLNALDATTAAEMPSRLHFLKGSALNLGLDYVSELCRIEETKLKTDPASQADIAAIRSAYATSKEMLLKPGTSRPHTRLLSL